MDGDVDIGAHAKRSRLHRCGIEKDFYGNALYDFHEVSRRVLRGQRARAVNRWPLAMESTARKCFAGLVYFDLCAVTGV